uniref:Methylcrotonoyl-CoA carboxylase subunit alpha, mitochondrial n=1 Tax=Diabrotica virgifera virgifera TaxID=50390 RepID=A0A6P7F7C2_DIAVI
MLLTKILINGEGIVNIFSKQYYGIRRKSTLRKIDKLLIANRGEIACRIVRTAKRLGVRTVAVYSDADEKSLHVSLADEAYRIGPATASQSYLRGDKLLEVAKKSGSQAIHPGYGFLSENVEFAERCQKEGIIFIGPPSSAIKDMGIKSTSKAIMSAAGVPIVEGYHGEDQSIETLKKEAKRIGFPVMIKAVRGGGGKGKIKMGLNHLIIDTKPGLSSKLRNELGMAAVRAAKAVGYVGAGTVEFILDKKSHAFHFMEMNTRLQVEHPITEMITDTDLVEWQIKVASGEKLPLSQEEITLKGHAFEARIYAEDPRGGFLPGAGHLSYVSTPEAADDTRIETGVRQGDEVSIHYDPMIAKLVVWGKKREEGLSKLKAKLREYNITCIFQNVCYVAIPSYQLKFKDTDIIMTGRFNGDNRFSFSCDGGKTYTDAHATITKFNNKNILTATINDIIYKTNVYRNEEVLALFGQEGKLQFSLPRPTYVTQQEEESSTGLANKAVSPMPGVLDKLLVKCGDTVKKGDSLFILIAMKMEYVVKASRDATISKVNFAVGDNVPKDSTIIQFDIPE